MSGVSFKSVSQLIFLHNFGECWDIYGLRPIILGYFFPYNYDGNKHISFQDL